tara:strand:- start:559 stop:1116 length:558 start_codon:yes stop_codon:yes gene_type:complete
MTQTINFCGDSFCAHPGDDSWPIILSRLLGYNICGMGKNGTAYEHAIKSFNPKATATVFCWTEIHRIYHPKISLNMKSVEMYKHCSKIHAAGSEYYKHLHSFDFDFERKERDFFWFDEKVLSKYEGKIVHLFCFENAVYPFKYGKVVRTPLYTLKAGLAADFPNHMTIENNKKIAKSIFKLLRNE